jgi:4'-phosphopantetheinyl transferase
MVGTLGDLRHLPGWARTRDATNMTHVAHAPVVVRAPAGPAMGWWLAVGEDALPPGTGWLAPGEAERAAVLRHPRRTEYLLRRLAAKRAVAAVAGLPADPAALSHIEVGNLPSGAPVVHVDGSRVGLGISLTGRTGWAVCLVGTRVGCDLELVEPRSTAFVRDSLTLTELRFMASRPDATGREVAANAVWSAKKSALKVLHTGLRHDTRDLGVRLATVAAGWGWCPLVVRVPEYGVFPGWWRRDGAFVLTVVADSAGLPPEALGDVGALAAAVPRHSWLTHPALNCTESPGDQGVAMR